MDYKDSVNKRFIDVCNLLISDKVVENKAKLAASLEIKSNKYSEIMSQRMRAGVNEIQKLCNTYNVSFEYIFNGTGEIFFKNYLTQFAHPIRTPNSHTQSADLHTQSTHPIGKKTKKDSDKNVTQLCDPNMLLQSQKMSPHYVTPIEEPKEKDDNIYFDSFTQVVPPTLQPMSTILDRRLERQQVPLYDIDASAGIVPILDGLSTPVDYISIPNLPKCDGAVSVRGDSMYPLLKSGDIVLFKSIHDFDCIMWGEMYLIVFRHDDEEFCVVKYVQRCEKQTKIKLVSYNEHHNPIEIFREEIRALAIIKASIRFNTIM